MLLIGHRGARGEAPENTLPSFRHAMNAGIRHFELDVRLAADGVPVVVHDSTVLRTCGIDGAVHTFTSTQLAALDARSNTAGWPEPAGIPSLRDVLLACHDCESWQLEIKSDDALRIAALVRAIHELIEELGVQNRVTLTSLDVKVLETAQQAAPNLPRAYVAEFAEPAPLSVIAQFDCRLLVANWRIVTDALVQESHVAGIPVSVWTVNDLVIAERLLKAGVDSLITDFPTALQAHFAMRARRDLPRA